MLIVPEARTAIVRVAVVVAAAIACIVGAIRTHVRWVRVVLAAAAVPIVLFAVLGILIVSLILRYGPR